MHERMGQIDCVGNRAKVSETFRDPSVLELGDSETRAPHHAQTRENQPDYAGNAFGNTGLIRYADEQHHFRKHIERKPTPGRRRDNIRSEQNAACKKDQLVQRVDVVLPLIGKAHIWIQDTERIPRGYSQDAHEQGGFSIFFPRNEKNNRKQRIECPLIADRPGSCCVVCGGIQPRK